MRSAIFTMTQHNTFKTMSQRCFQHTNNPITKVDFSQLLGPATISVNECSTFEVVLRN